MILYTVISRGSPDSKRFIRHSVPENKKSAPQKRRTVKVYLYLLLHKMHIRDNNRVCTRVINHNAREENTFDQSHYSLFIMIKDKKSHVKKRYKKPFTKKTVIPDFRYSFCVAPPLYTHSTDLSIEKRHPFAECRLEIFTEKARPLGELSRSD